MTKNWHGSEWGWLLAVAVLTAAATATAEKEAPKSITPLPKTTKTEERATTPPSLSVQEKLPIKTTVVTTPDQAPPIKADKAVGAIPSVAITSDSKEPPKVFPDLKTKTVTTKVSPAANIMPAQPAERAKDVMPKKEDLPDLNSKSAATEASPGEPPEGMAVMKENLKKQFGPPSLALPEESPAPEVSTAPRFKPETGPEFVPGLQPGQSRALTEMERANLADKLQRVLDVMNGLHEGLGVPGSDTTPGGTAPDVTAGIDGFPGPGQDRTIPGVPGGNVLPGWGSADEGGGGGFGNIDTGGQTPHTVSGTDVGIPGVGSGQHEGGIPAGVGDHRSYVQDGEGTSHTRVEVVIPGLGPVTIIDDWSGDSSGTGNTAPGGEPTGSGNTGSKPDQTSGFVHPRGAKYWEVRHYDKRDGQYKTIIIRDDDTGEPAETWIWKDGKWIPDPTPDPLPELAPIVGKGSRGGVKRVNPEGPYIPESVRQDAMRLIAAIRSGDASVVLHPDVDPNPDDDGGGKGSGSPVDIGPPPKPDRPVPDDSPRGDIGGLRDRYPDPRPDTGPGDIDPVPLVGDEAPH